jgi:hypothetical protein
MSFKIQAAENITDMAEAKSSGKCAAYVREAIQRAKGIKVEPTGILSAKDYGPWLVKQGYWVKGDQSIASANPGNVIVIDAVNHHDSRTYRHSLLRWTVEVRLRSEESQLIDRCQ